MKQVENLLSEMTYKQKEPLIKILGIKETEISGKNEKFQNLMLHNYLKNNYDSDIIVQLSKILLPVKGLWQTPLTYRQFIEKLASRNSENINFSEGVTNAEKELYLKLFQNEFEQLSAEEKEKIYAELEKAGMDRSQLASLGGVSALGAAQLSGFGIYLLASSTVGAITSVLGLTLPFAFYTTMSSAISFVIGPVGFLVMGVLLYRSFKHVKSWEEALDILNTTWKELGNLVRGDYQRATIAFKYLAASRVLLERELSENITESEKEIDEIKQNLQPLLDNIEVKDIELEQIDNEMEILQKEINVKREKILAIKQSKNDLMKEKNKIDDEISAWQKDIAGLILRIKKLNG